MGRYAILLEEPVFLLLVEWIRKDGVRICAVCTILNFLCLNVLTLKAYYTPTSLFCNGTCSVQRKSEECEPWRQEKLRENLCMRKFNTIRMRILAHCRNFQTLTQRKLKTQQIQRDFTFSEPCIVQYLCEKTNKCASCWSSPTYKYNFGTLQKFKLIDRKTLCLGTSSLRNTVCCWCMFCLHFPV